MKVLILTSMWIFMKGKWFWQTYNNMEFSNLTLEKTDIRRKKSLHENNINHNMNSNTNSNTSKNSYFPLPLCYYAKWFICMNSLTLTIVLIHVIVTMTWVEESVNNLLRSFSWLSSQFKHRNLTLWCLHLERHSRVPARESYQIYIGQDVYYISTKIRHKTVKVVNLGLFLLSGVFCCCWKPPCARR